MASQTLNLANLPGYLRAKAAGLSDVDLTPPLKSASVLLASATKQNFANQSDPDGVPWEPLKRPRWRKKGSPGGSDLILRNTGVLMASETGSGDGNINEVTPRSLRWGTSVFYAIFQQSGTSSGKGRGHNIPARRSLGLTAELKQRISDIIARYVARLTKGAV